MLFCKPAKNQIIYQQFIGNGKTLVLRSLILNTDARILHQWVTAPYAKKFWQMNVPLQEFLSFYELLLNNPHAHSFTGLLNEEPVCQIDAYRIQQSELAGHIQFNYNDCGMHLLMAPIHTHMPQLSMNVMVMFMFYYFSFSSAQNLYAEPDINNHKACSLLEKSGFIFLHHVTLTDKTANLYLMTKKKFYETHAYS